MQTHVMLRRLWDAGYRGEIVIAKWYRCEKWDFTDGGIGYGGQYRYHHPEWRPCNFLEMYREYVMSKRQKTA